MSYVHHIGGAFGHLHRQLVTAVRNHPHAVTPMGVIQKADA